jgi:hypothetical protein
MVVGGKSDHPSIFPSVIHGSPHTYRVYVEGAVSRPGWVRVPPGAPVGDLARWVELKPDADRSFLTKKRPIRDGEHLNIPFRN